jgi:hypothetical protein
MNGRPGPTQNAAPSSDAYRRLIERLPVTMRPAFNQQLSQWNTLFPFEQNLVASFMKGVEALGSSGIGVLTAPLWKLESKMNVKDWNFSQAHDTIENASQLARSEYYGEWRREVQRVFDAVNAAARDSERAQPKPTRCILLFLPRSLPIDARALWKQWDPRGHEIKISGDSERLCQLVLQGRSRQAWEAIQPADRGNIDSSDLWLIDAGATLGSMLSHRSPIAASSLGYANLKPFRDRFLAELNKAPKSIRATDEIVASLRLEAWDGWGLWPPEIANDPRLRKFVIDLFLSGNGALIFSNAFVEWAVSEALRRARPRTIIARFGMRSKPKLFTSIAVFENQQKISSVPDVDDPENSAVDAAILARYAWLAASRYPEQEQTLCLCVAEHTDSAYAILPAAKSLESNPAHTMGPEELYGWLETWGFTPIQA